MAISIRPSRKVLDARGEALGPIANTMGSQMVAHPLGSSRGAKRSRRRPGERALRREQVEGLRSTSRDRSQEGISDTSLHGRGIEARRTLLLRTPSKDRHP